MPTAVTALVENALLGSNKIPCQLREGHVAIAFVSLPHQLMSLNEEAYEEDSALLNFLSGQKHDVKKLSFCGMIPSGCYPLSVLTLLEVLDRVPSLAHFSMDSDMLLYGSAVQFNRLSHRLQLLTQTMEVRLDVDHIYVLRQPRMDELEAQAPGMLNDAITTLSENMSSFHLVCSTELINVKALAKLGLSTPSIRLTKLALEDPIDDARVVALFGGLENNNVLKTLRISCDNLSKTEGAKSICKMLRNNSTLQEFDLDCMSQTDEETILALLEDLAFSKLRSFGFDGHFACAGDEGLKQGAIQMLAANEYLEAFDFFCPHCCTFMDELSFYLLINRLGRRQVLPTSDASKWVEVLSREEQTLATLHYFLSHNPELIFNQFPPSRFVNVKRPVNAKRKRLFRSTKYNGKKQYRF